MKGETYGKEGEHYLRFNLGCTQGKKYRWRGAVDAGDTIFRWKILLAIFREIAHLFL